MAATGYTPISLYYTTVSARPVPAGTLVPGELALNAADGTLFYYNTGSASIQQIKAVAIAGGANTQVQYNNSGALAGSANMTFNGTSLTLANDATIHGLTVGLGGGAVATNTAFGVGAGTNPSQTGISNSAFGWNALDSNLTGVSNTAVGRSALTSNSSGNDNVAVGTVTLTLNTAGSSNVAVGSNALRDNTGSANTALGHYALQVNTTASNNTAVGYQALYTQSGTTGPNTAIGYQAGYNLTTGTYNTFVGVGAVAYSMTTGSKNTIIGNYSGNQGGLDIRTASNYIVLSDGDGNPRVQTNNLGITSIPSTTYAPNINLTDAATVAWDTSLGQVATFTFVSSNRTMGAPTNLVNGGFYALAVIQNGGGNTLTWNSVFKWAGGVAPTLSTAAGAKDYFVFRSDGSSLFQQGASLNVS